jgi:hypothetical protein
MEAVSKACSTTGLNEENHELERKPDVTDNNVFVLHMFPNKRGDLKETVSRTPKQRMFSGKPPTYGALVGVRETSEAPKKANGGRLAETLDRTLEPRVAPGKPGRPAGGKYEWMPEMDKLLVEFASRYAVAKAKDVSADRLMEFEKGGAKPGGAC